MRYSKHYSKLDEDEYTTIRRYKKKRRVGKVEEETVNFHVIHRAMIKRIERKTFNNIPLKLLLKDTDCKTREEAFLLIDGFYMKPIDKKKEKLYIFYMKKVNKIG